MGGGGIAACRKLPGALSAGCFGRLHPSRLAVKDICLRVRKGGGVGGCLVWPLGTAIHAAVPRKVSAGGVGRETGGGGGKRGGSAEWG